MRTFALREPARAVRSLALGLATAVAAASFAAPAVLAQDAAKPAASDTKPAEGADASGGVDKRNAWIKLCNQDENLKKEVCVVTQELREANSGRLLASATVRMVEGEKPGMIFAVPVGMLLRPGVQIQIDKDKPRRSPYSVCFPNACVSHMQIDDEYIEALKRGAELYVAVIKPQDQKPVAFPLTLSGFTAAIEGPAADPKLFEQGQKNLAAEIQKRAKEAREKAAKEQGEQKKAE